MWENRQKRRDRRGGAAQIPQQKDTTCVSIHHLLLDPDQHPVIAHRGASGLAPENTLEAFELGLAQGAEALELDVQLAGCGTPVVLHDPSLDRTTSETGMLRTRTAADLARCDAGFRFTPDGTTFPWRGRGIRVPTLALVLERFPTTPLLIELKTVEVADPVRRLLLRHGAATRVVLASFLDAALAPFRTAPFATSASRRSILRLWLRSRFGLRATGPDRVYSVPEHYRERIRVPTPAFIRAARRAGCPVHVWTVNDPLRAGRLWQLGVSGIITNFPALVLAERTRRFGP